MSENLHIVYPAIACYNASMGKLKAISNTFSSLTGISGRHNRALQETAGFLNEIQRFFTSYNLPEESPGYKSLIENIGYAKFDLTNLAYRIRPLIKTAGDIRGVKASPLMENILNQLEDFRRALMDPSLRRAQLKKIIGDLHESVTDLQTKLAEIEYK
jgi:hypothetical protein